MPRFHRVSHAWRASLLTGSALLIAAARASAAPAEHVEVELRYERQGGSESCPGESDLRLAVAARLGYDPFVTKDGVDTIAVRVRRAGPGVEGTIERLDGARHHRGKPTTITSKSNDCAELGAALAVAIAIAVDPLSLTREPPAPLSPPPAPEPAPVPAPVADERPQPPPKAEPGVPTQVVVGLGPQVSAGALPAAALGVRALAGVVHGRFEVDVEGRFDPPVAVGGTGGHIEASLVLGTVAPCVRYHFALACADLSLGALRGTGLGFDHTREDVTFYASAGGRLGVDAALSDRFAVRILAGGQIPLRPTRLEADSVVIWSTPAFAFSGAALLTARF